MSLRQKYPGLALRMRITFGNFVYVSFAIVFACCQSQVASAKVPVNVDDLDPLLECKRRDVSVVESNNKVYMYGGQSWVKNGTQKPFQITNHYLRIVDFTTPRKLSDQSIMTTIDIPGDVPIFMNGAFWVDDNTAYVIGGQVNDEAWLSRQGEFLPSNWTKGVGGKTVYTCDLRSGKWSYKPTIQPSVGAQVTDSFAAGLFAYNKPRGRAYYFSGTNAVGARKLDPFTVPGYISERKNDQVTFNTNLLTFNVVDSKWSNVTVDTRLAPRGRIGGRLVFLPGTESASGGVAIALGGWRFQDEMEKMDKVLVFDSATGSWYVQTTTVEGDQDFPTGRWYFCAIGTSAPDNSSHNILMYGGEYNNTGSPGLSDMWILSLPSFHWIPLRIDSSARKALGCTTVGQRYIVTFGGVSAQDGREGDQEACDQDDHGLRLFDLSSLAWMSDYPGPASSAHAYAVPSSVYNVIGGNAQGGATRTAPLAGFETAGLASLFPRAIASSSTSFAPSPTGLTTPAKKHTNIKAIIGGVVGGIAGLVVMILGVLYFMKREKNHMQQSIASTIPYNAESKPAELADAQASELPTGPVTELPTHQKGESRIVYEM